MVRNITCDGDGCEDIAQDVFLAAYRKLGSYDCSRSRFSTWLFTIAKNRSINWLRRRRAVSMDGVGERVDATEPGAEIEHKELMAELDRCLAELSGRQRRVFVLAEFEGLGYEEIARIERTRVGTVRSRMSRARAKLRRALERFDGE